MAVSKVIYGGDTVMDITDSTVTADTLTAGTVGYAANGERTTGRFVANLPVGFLFFSLSPTIPTGWLPCDGSTFVPIPYMDLWTHILEENNYKTFDEWQSLYDANDGNVPYFAVSQTGSQTQWQFRTPSIKGWVRGGTKDEVGTYLPAGLPNITGASSDAGSVVGIWIVKAFDTVTNVAGQDVSDISAVLTSIEMRVSAFGQDVSDISAVLTSIEKRVSAFGQDVSDISAVLTSIEKRVSALETAPEPIHIVDTFNGNNCWYRKYSDGWIEQGGRTPNVAGTGTDYTVTLNKAFTTTTYTVQMTPDWETASGDNGTFALVTKSKTNFTFRSTDDKLSKAGDWFACGY